MSAKERRRKETTPTRSRASIVEVVLFRRSLKILRRTYVVGHHTIRVGDCPAMLPKNLNKTAQPQSIDLPASHPPPYTPPHQNVRRSTRMTQFSTSVVPLQPSTVYLVSMPAVSTSSNSTDANRQ